MNNPSLNNVPSENTENAAEESTKASFSAPEGNVRSRRVKKAQDAFRTISEVADKLDVQQHVLRFWETKFSQVKPLKRGGGRRYYRPEDVALLERIHHLLYTEGYTIKGVQKLMKGQAKSQIVAEANNQNTAQVTKSATTNAMTTPVQQDGSNKMSDQQRAVLEIMLGELKAMRAMLNA